MVMSLLALISPKWSATTATKLDILLRNAELQEIKNKESTRRTVHVETSTSTALVSYDGLGGSDLEVSNNTNCSKSYLKTVETLKSQYDQLHKDFKKSEVMVLAYKSRLESVEEKLEVYKANEFIYSQDIKIVNNYKKGLGYNAVPPPYTGNFMPPTPDLFFIGLDEFANNHVVKNRKSDEELSKVVRKSNDSPIITDRVSDSKEENVTQTKTEKKTVKPSIAKIEFVKPKQQEKTARKIIKQVEKQRQNTQSPRGNQRNWNNMMSQRLGSNFEMFNKACYVCGSFDHLQIDCNYHHQQFQKQRMVKPVWNNAQRVNHQNFAKKTHPCAKKNMVPRAVLIKSGLVSVNTARQVKAAHIKTTVNAARTMSYLSKTTHSTVKRPIHKKKTFMMSQSPRGNQRNWNNMMSQRLGSNFEMFNKACYVCGSFDHLQVDCNYHHQQFQKQRMVKPVWNNAQRVNHQNFAKKTHPCAKKNMVPRAVLIKSGLVSVNTARQVKAAHIKTTVNAARTMSYLFKTTHSTVKRPIHKKKTFKNSHFNQRVNTVKDKNVNTVRPKAVVNAARPKAVVNAVKGNNVNVVKASACWVWKPKTKVLDHDQGMIDSGCSRHMTGNMSYLTDYEEIDGGYVAFGGNLKGGKITRKVVIDVFSRFTWVFFLATKDETSGILKSFIIGIENLLDHKIKYSVARTPQQNGVAERRNKTLIKAARTMLADSKLPTTFWAEAVSTACYVQNRVLVVKPHNKTPYEPFHGRTPTLSFMRPFMCPDTIINTIDHLGKFDGKADEGFFVRYSLNSKAFRVFNSRTRIVEENLHIMFSESTPNVVGSRLDWLFDIDALTKTMNYETIVADYILLPLWIADLKSSHDDGSKPSSDDEKKVDEDPGKDSKSNDQEKEDNVNSTNNVNAASSNEVNAIGAKTSIEILVDPNIHALEDYSIFNFSSVDQDDDAEADMNNLDKTIQVSPNPTTRIHKDHPLNQVIEDLQSATQIRKMSKNFEEHGKNPKRNKKDEREILIRNKARLVTQGYTQEEGIDYDEVFAPVARIKAIRLFLAYASFKDFVVYQMDIKSAFLYGKIEEKVYEGDILLVQVYVDDIILGSTKKELCNAFENQDKYVDEILKKFEFTEVKTTSTPIKTQKPLLKDENGEDVDVHMYRSMIGSLMYLTSSRPDIIFAVCACARYQVNTKVSHLHAVKKNF
ncbi:retrovirus-related pol polyprotein from transposon TNT 1-94 [Tanacetum coccineum]